ncbi:hypothetical protein BDV96DRAFT_23889 [Lophiotrema nucula]|uniref:Uncharacterized protein n=1 Tax=Lophiotrema nucula TaxID=690887 RepID=A0A6A5ZDK1_9PLEO|nr:hypothetical protein BDV96DRAFT_23889 [Lophiotrema nucula]
MLEEFWRWARNKPKHKLKKAKSDKEAQEYLNQIAGIVSNILELGHDDGFGSLRVGERSMRTTPAEGVYLLGKEYKRLYADNRNLDNRLRSLEQEHMRTKRLLDEADERHSTALAIEQSSHESKLNETTENYDNIIHSQKLQYENTIAQLRRNHQQKVDRLTKDVQSRNKALVARDTFVPISDADIKSETSQLVVAVEEWARTKWEFNHSPWTDEVQRKITKIPRRLQKQILMDSIWTIFHEYIFCSPFRVLGKEGDRLEKQWNDVFGRGKNFEGSGYAWPEPKFDAEQWRYNTLRPCEEALRIGTSEHDHRTKLRRGFDESLDLVQQKLLETFQMVANLDERRKQSLYELAERAAKMWVLFGTQRCRLLVAMHNLPTSLESSESHGDEDQSIDFVLRPEVRRIGDVDGEALDKELIVSGCEGEAIRVMYSS